jgi:hypothetical protein
MRRNRLRPLVAGLVLGALLLATVSPVAAHRGDGGRPSRPADTYVAAWDAVGIQAFNAAAVAPAEAAAAAAAHRVLVRYVPTPSCLAPDRGDSAGRCGHR